MSKICPKCNKEWPDEFMTCPLDGTTLVSKPQQPAGFSLNLGDANAISGGVNMSDNHSVSNNTVNTTTSNVDSHNVITNNITQVEREKSPEELKHEKELSFRKECLKVLSDGIMTSEEKRQLEDLQYNLGLDDQSAKKILAEVTKRSERKSSILSPVHQITFNNIKTAINANRLDLVNRLMAQMKAMVRRYSVEEIQFTYYMLQAVLHPKDCIDEYEKHYEDKYWQTFWSSIAYRRTGDIEKSELLVADVGDKWIDTIPQENVFILASVNALIDKDFETAKSLFDNISGEHSPYLSNLISCLYALLYGDTFSSEEELKQLQKDGTFYTNNLFAEEKKLKEEAEAKRIAEEKKQQEEAEAKRLAKEKKRQEEAEAKRLAEEKKRQEEAEAKRRAEEKKNQESATSTKQFDPQLLKPYINEFGFTFLGSVNAQQRPTEISETRPDIEIFNVRFSDTDKIDPFFGIRYDFKVNKRYKKSHGIMCQIGIFSKDHPGIWYSNHVTWPYPDSNASSIVDGCGEHITAEQLGLMFDGIYVLDVIFSVYPLRYHSDSEMADGAQCDSYQFELTLEATTHLFWFTEIKVKNFTEIRRV